MKIPSFAHLLTLLLLGSFLWLMSACKGEVEPDQMIDDDEDTEQTEQTDSTAVAEDVIVIETFAITESVVVSGDVADGRQLDDLAWAARSSVACFPGTRAIEFEGNQVFYAVTIPQGGELIVTVTPTGERKRINLYGYIQFDGNNTPPIESCTSCEAGYELYTGTPDLTQPGEPQSISFAQAVNREFTAFIAVSGARDVLSGTYDLSFRLDPM